MPKSDFSATEVARLAGIPYQTLNRWLNDAVISCDVPAEGTGSRRRFTRDDIVAVILAKTLKDHGVPMDAVSGIVGSLRRAHQSDSLENAGWLLVKSWDNSGMIVSFCPDATALGQRLDGLRNAVSSSTAWTGVILVIDAGHFAAKTYARLAELRGKGGR